MAGDSEGNGSNRATVALVSEKLDGLRLLVEVQFKGVQSQLDSVTGLPLIVNGLMERIKAHERRLDNLERENEREDDHRRATLPTWLIGIGGLLLTALNIYVAAKLGAHG